MSSTPSRNGVRNTRISPFVTVAAHSGFGARMEHLEDRRLLSVAAPAQSTGGASPALIISHIILTAVPPVFGTLPDATVTVGSTFRYKVAALGRPAPRFSLVDPPEGMLMNGRTGLILWTPTAADAGIQTITVTATNRLGSSSTSFNITVSNPVAPTLSVPPTLPAAVGGAFTYQVVATGFPAPGLSLVSGPVRMTMSADGLISWLPTALGSQNVTVSASNPTGTVSSTFAVVVGLDVTPPTAPIVTIGPITTIDSIPLSWSGSTDNVGVVGYRIYNFTPAVYRGHSGRGGGYYLVSPARFTLLVDGITANNYTFTGLATSSLHRYTVVAYDAAGNHSGYSSIVTGTMLTPASFTWSYYGATNPALNDVADHAITVYFNTTGNPAPTLTMVSAPAGVTYTPGQNTNSQLTTVIPTISWTPTPDEVGLNYITMQATNSVGTYTYSIPVTVTPDTPQISVSLNGGYTYSAGQFAAGQSNYVVTTNPGFGNYGYPNPPIPQYAMPGTPFNFQVTSAGNAGPTTLSLVSGPVGMTFDPVTGAGTWTPAKDQGGNTGVVVTATNSAGTSTLHLNFPTYFTGAPGVPAAHYYTSVSGTGTSNPTMTWTAPADTIGVAGYRLIVTDAHTGVITTFDTHSTDTSYALSGLGSQQYFVTVTSLDANGNAGIVGPAVSILGGAISPVSWNISTPTPTVGTPLSVQFTPATGGYVYSIVSGPTGAVIDPHTGLLLWTPAQSGDAKFVIAAVNGWGEVDAVLDILV